MVLYAIAPQTPFEQAIMALRMTKHDNQIAKLLTVASPSLAVSGTQAPNGEWAALKTINVSIKEVGAVSDNPGLELTMTITPDGVAVMTNQKAVPAVEGCAKEGPTFCKKDGSHDWAGLYGFLVSLKKAHQSETVLTIGARPGVATSEVIKAIDIASRLRVTAKGNTPADGKWSLAQLEASKVAECKEVLDCNASRRQGTALGRGDGACLHGRCARLPSFWRRWVGTGGVMHARRNGVVTSL